MSQFEPGFGEQCTRIYNGNFFIQKSPKPGFAKKLNKDFFLADKQAMAKMMH